MLTLTQIGILSKLYQRGLYDYNDRLIYCATSIIFLLAMVTVSSKQYIGSPISCYIPPELDAGLDKYAEAKCLAQKTYYIPIQDQIPEEQGERKILEFGYYQWVPVVLVLQAFMFYLPNWIWKMVYRNLNFDADKIISNSEEYMNLESHNEKNLRLIKIAEEIRKIEKFSISIYYISIKLFYLSIIIIQLIFMNQFLGFNFIMWGFQIIYRICTAHSNQWFESRIFPTETLCDIEIRRLANYETYTLQCVMSINSINEKVYLFLWTWLMFIIISTFINLIYCIRIFFSENLRNIKMKKMIQSKLSHDHTDETINDFFKQSFNSDHYVMIRFISVGVNKETAAQIIFFLYENFYVRTVVLRREEEEA